ncbi:threonine/serine exporter family protein [Niallia sp. XMNu-256]|uniref:threonine/serine exporter family protein n=1 Tax=Niallia sp. XMNu-256 TaxID=3082444 RepID=UPI0030D17B91
MDLTKREIGKIVEVCMLAGEILLRSGAETARIEDTMNRMASAFGLSDSQSFVQPMGIFFAAHRDDRVKLIRVVDRSTDLQKVAIVNGISRKISEGQMTVEQALSDLKEIARIDLSYPLWIQIFAAMIVSGSFLIMFRGGWGDFLPAMITGGIGHSFYIYLHKVIKIKFFAEGAASFVIGLLAVTAVWNGWGTEIDKIIIASVMTLVPGLLITNAVRDLMDGHFASALAKGADAFLTALSIGTGIAVVVGFVFKVL